MMHTLLSKHIKRISTESSRWLLPAVPSLAVPPSACFRDAVQSEARIDGAVEKEHARVKELLGSCS